MTETISFVVTAQLLLDILSSALYASHDYSLWEVVRNGVCACMPNPKRWIAGAGDVEIFIKDHPLAPNAPCLIVLDHGRGFTEDGFKRFFTLGASMEDMLQNPGGMHGGASQKRIGRFAALALNLRCFRDKDGSSGFFVLTRNTVKGNVCLIPLIPNEYEKHQGVKPVEISPDDDRMGFLKGIHGTFTAIVVANSVFTTYAEVREALQWRIPRRKNQMFKLKVQGEALTPPALASKFCDVSPDGTIEMYLDRAKEGDSEPGVWFCDQETGLRVACAREMSASHVPYPFYSPDLVGDIFVPGLLGKQGTSRSTLAPAFLRTQAWVRVTRYLITQAERVRGLLGEGEPKPRSPARAAISELAELCNRVFGPPDKLQGGGEVIDLTNPPVVTRPEPKIDPVDVTTTPTPKGKRRGGGGGTRDRKKPEQAIRIGEKTYRIMNVATEDRRVLVRVSGDVIYYNTSYDLLPALHAARLEHIWQAVLMAVAHSEKPDGALLDLVLQVSGWRSQLFRKAAKPG